MCIKSIAFLCTAIIKVWNEDLANLAQMYAEECDFTHNADRQLAAFTSVGENLAATSSSGAPDYTGLVQQWYNEVNDYTYSTNQCVPGRACGHYTQVSYDDG